MWEYSSCGSAGTRTRNQRLKRAVFYQATLGLPFHCYFSNFCASGHLAKTSELTEDPAPCHLSRDLATTQFREFLHRCGRVRNPSSDFVLTAIVMTLEWLVNPDPSFVFYGGEFAAPREFYTERCLCSLRNDRGESKTDGVCLVIEFDPDPPVLVSWFRQVNPIPSEMMSFLSTSITGSLWDAFSSPLDFSFSNN